MQKPHMVEQLSVSPERQTSVVLGQAAQQTDPDISWGMDVIHWKGVSRGHQ